MYIYRLIIYISLYIYYILPPSLCVCVCACTDVNIHILNTRLPLYYCPSATLFLSLLPFTPPLYHSTFLFFIFTTTRTSGQAYATQKRGYYSSTPPTGTSSPVFPLFFVKKKTNVRTSLRDAETGLLLEYSSYRHLLTSLPPFFC